MFRKLSYLSILVEIIKNKKGGSTIESGLLIALAMIIFLLLVGIITNLYDWISGQVDSVLDLDFLKEI